MFAGRRELHSCPSAVYKDVINYLRKKYPQVKIKNPVNAENTAFARKYSGGDNWDRTSDPLHVKKLHYALFKGFASVYMHFIVNSL